MPKPKEKKIEKKTAGTKAASAPKSPKGGVSSLAVTTGGFNLFESRKKNKELTRDLMAKAGLADGFKSASEIRRQFLPVPWMAMQYLMSCIGIPVNTITDFIGQENVGKSSLAVSLLCEWTKRNMPCYYISTEPKTLEADWIMRLAGVDRETAEAVIDALYVDEKTYTLDTMDQKLRRWVEIQRNEVGVPKSVPLVVVVDSVTKLLNPEEAAVLTTEAEQKKAVMTNVKLSKGVSDVSQKPGVTAKWLHEWSRIIAPILDYHNVTVILVSGQNTKMQTGMAGNAPDGGASLNKTKTGGNAINQSAATQMTVTYKGMWKDTSTDLAGKLINLRIVKGAYGPTFRSISYGLRNERFNDSSEYVDQAIDMDFTLCDLLVSKKLFKMTCTSKAYTSDVLGIYGESAKSVVSKIMSDEALCNKVGYALGIKGYVDPDTNEPVPEETEGTAEAG